jgi:hypothetical protein
MHQLDLNIDAAETVTIESEGSCLAAQHDPKTRSLLVMLAETMVKNALTDRKLGYKGKYAKPYCDPEVTQQLVKFRNKLRKNPHKNPFDLAQGFLHPLRQRA